MNNFRVGASSFGSLLLLAVFCMYLNPQNMTDRIEHSFDEKNQQDQMIVQHSTFN